MSNPLAEPERVAFVGDWHANTSWAVLAIEHAKERGADVIVHLGDFGYAFQARFVGDVADACRRTGLHLLFVDGNHEDFRRLNRFPQRDDGLRVVADRVWHLPRGHRWEWGGLRLLACGGAHSVDRPWREPGVSWWPQEWVTDDDVVRCVDGGPADMLVAHDCPTGVDIPGLRPDLFPPLEILRADEHRAVLRRIVDGTQPAVVWHGHYHQAYRRTVDFGYGPVTVTGLDCDGTTLAGNVAVVDLAVLAASVAASREGVPVEPC